MNTSLVKTVPPGDFVAVSVLQPGWEDAFHSLVGQNRSIQFDVYPRPGIPPEIQSRLRQQGYSALVLENDRWQHFLIPNPR